MKIFEKKASSELIAVLISIAVIGSASFVVHRQIQNTYASSGNSVNSKLGSQMIMYSK